MCSLGDYVFIRAAHPIRIQEILYARRVSEVDEGSMLSNATPTGTFFQAAFGNRCRAVAVAPQAR